MKQVTILTCPNLQNLLTLIYLSRADTKRFYLPDFYRRTKWLRMRHQFSRDFSRPIEIGQYQTVLILHQHVNRLKSANK